MLMANAINQGFSETKKPKIKAADKTSNTEIPESSQFGSESIQAIERPVITANEKKIGNLYFIFP